EQPHNLKVPVLYSIVKWYPPVLVLGIGVCLGVSQEQPHNLKVSIFRSLVKWCSSIIILGAGIHSQISHEHPHNFDVPPSKAASLHHCPWHWGLSWSQPRAISQPRGIHSMQQCEAASLCCWFWC